MGNPIYTQATGTSNPFNGIDVGYFSAPAFADINGDGKIDLVVGERLGGLSYYKNTGSPTNPSYSQQIGTSNPFNGIHVGFSSSPSFADINDDGVIDLVVGESAGNLNYYKNVGTPTGPSYTLQSGTSDPFNGISVGPYSHPSFADINDDGKLDLLVGNSGRPIYYKNTGSLANASYSKQTGTSNPFDGIDVGFSSSPSFADINDDGVIDLVVGESAGNLNYYKNVGTPTGPSYTLQSGTSDPFNGISVGRYSQPSFADINGDGKLDLVVGDYYGTLTAYFTCFLAGTLIATPAGERPIETLQPGDLITTAEGPQPVRFISRTSHLAPLLDANDVLPIRIAAGALGARGPVRDLYVSPDHAILIDGHLL